MQHRTRQATFSFFLLASCALWTFPPKSCRATALLHRLAPSQSSTSPFLSGGWECSGVFVTEHYRLPGLNNRDSLVRVLEAGCSGFCWGSLALRTTRCLCPHGLLSCRSYWAKFHIFISLHYLFKVLPHTVAFWGTGKSGSWHTDSEGRAQCDLWHASYNSPMRDVS